MENKENEQILIDVEKAFQRVLDSKRLSLEEIIVLIQYGVTTGIVFINQILQTIEERGEKAASKKFSGDQIDILINSINSEFYYRTGHFYANGSGLQIPLDLSLAHVKVIRLIHELDSEMLYGKFELGTEINQRELAYLFSALANGDIFHSSADLLAYSIAEVTNYSEQSIRRVILDFKKTKGGIENEEKKKILKKIEKLFDSF
jgi:hypothetical protein